MMPCTRLYVDPTAAPMSQARKNRLLGLLKQSQDNMRGHNSFLIIVTSKGKHKSVKKGRKQAPKESGNWI